MKNLILLYSLVLSFLFFQCKQAPAEPGTQAHIQKVTKAVDDNALKNADKKQGDWLSYGRNYKEDRYSELDEITKENVSQLGLAWSLPLYSKRGVEATPIVVDGIMYLTASWSKVFAIDVRTGKQLWEYDPKVPREYGEYACCDVINRGVALYKGSVFVGTLDGRLISLDAATGTPNWEILTVDKSKKYTITGAPRIIKGRVVIGNGGAEYDARGYVTAYDAQTGKRAWRFYTVPGDPSKPFENKILEKAAKTWTGEWWKMGGGGTVWDAIVYDPELNLVYIGVGNGTPWDRENRSPEGGDNLFLSSIVALNADSGEYVWHYQTTPGDSWDFTATQPLVLADLKIEGKQRKVIMQAPKNGFFYVIDRTDGSFISAEQYTYQNWAKGIDENGRPIEQEYARYLDGQNTWISPGPYGGHNWQPMAYNSKTGLMYIPTHTIISPLSRNEAFVFNKVSGTSSGTGWNISFANKLYKPTRFDPNGPNPLAPYGRLIAWDPVKQKEVWGVKQLSYWNSGLLTTSTGLLFQADAEGKFKAYNADDGEVLWETDIRSGAIAPPITYSVDGKQYLTIAVGWGGNTGMNRKFTSHIHPGTVYTFVIGGEVPSPEKLKTPVAELTTLPPTGTPEQIGRGFDTYFKYCVVCHGDAVGAGGGVVPDLARSNDNIFENYNNIVLKGALIQNGMPNFGDRLSEQDLKDISNYIKFTSKSLREGMDYMTLMTKLAEMQYLADQKVAKKKKENK